MAGDSAIQCNPEILLCLRVVGGLFVLPRSFESLDLLVRSLLAAVFVNMIIHVVVGAIASEQFFHRLLVGAVGGAFASHVGRECCIILAVAGFATASSPQAA